MSPIGIDINMVPGKGYNLTFTHPLKNQPKRPIYMFDKKVVATPWSSGFRLGSTMEFSGYDLQLNEKRLQALKNAAHEYMELEIDESHADPWTGWRPMISREYPYIERSKKYSNLVIATGHGMLGLSMAPATGTMANQLINEQ